MSEFPRTLRRAMLCYCGEDLSRDSQRHKNYGGRRTGLCFKGSKCPLRKLGHGRWHVALAALKRMNPVDRSERYPHMQLREIELFVNENVRKKSRSRHRQRDRCRLRSSTRQGLLPTTTGHPSHSAVHRKPLLNPRSLVAARSQSSHGASNSQAPSLARSQGVVVLTPNTHSAQYINEGKSSSGKNEEGQQQGRPDKVGQGSSSSKAAARPPRPSSKAAARQQQVRPYSGSRSKIMLHQPPDSGLSSNGIKAAREKADAIRNDLAQVTAVEVLHQRLMHELSQPTTTATDMDKDEEALIPAVRILHKDIKHRRHKRRQTRSAATTTPSPSPTIEDSSTAQPNMDKQPDVITTATTTSTATKQEAVTTAATLLQAQREAEHEADYKSE